MTVTGVSTNRVQPRINNASTANNKLLGKINNDIAVFGVNRQIASAAISEMPTVAIHDNLKPQTEQKPDKIDLPDVLKPQNSEELQAQQENKDNPFAAAIKDMPLVAVHDNLKKSEAADKTELPTVLQPPTPEQLQEENAKKDNPFAKA